MKNKRYLGALILAPLLIFLFIGGNLLKFLLLALSLMGMYEFFNASKQKNINALSVFAYAFCILYYLFLNKFESSNIFLISISIFTFICLCIPVLSEKHNFIDVGITILAFIYVAVFFSFISLIEQKPHGNYLIWLVFLSSWLCDTTAYYVGKNFGKRKLNPRVSPNKSIEGSLGGLLGSTLACGVYGFFLHNLGINIEIYHFIFIGLLCGVFCQFGDLVASSIKRLVGLKDYSNLIPGHGGILDRFDSILFASVIVYSYISIIIAI
ncbi:phosphatidate cytidylyltransferase [Haloimpatiens lingqiaonensis]|uniref:phosphatidate cytidylyltransferase n=1 Tax=Haloimpatiens lingqiaonensis TaxID=1380675 RepID=UPI0010FDCAEB|nr:phosphatidate cytidylyltransferase [Haloimpatiens lingqiaonensis]